MARLILPNKKSEEIALEIFRKFCREKMVWISPLEFSFYRKFDLSRGRIYISRVS